MHGPHAPRCCRKKFTLHSDSSDSVRTSRAMASPSLLFLTPSRSPMERQRAPGWSDRQHNRFAPMCRSLRLDIPPTSTACREQDHHDSKEQPYWPALSNLAISSFHWSYHHVRGAGALSFRKVLDKGSLFLVSTSSMILFYRSALPSFLFLYPTVWEYSGKLKKGACAERRCRGGSRAWGGAAFLCE